MSSFVGNEALSRKVNMKSARVDMHSHVLPSFDDGSRSEEETFAILRDMKSKGTECVVWTPHYNHPKLPEIDYEKITGEYEKRFSFFEENTGVKILLGSELFLMPPLPEKLIPIGDTNYLLVEFSFNTYPRYILDSVYELSVMGYDLIFAHVERYSWLVEKKKKIFKTVYDFSLAEQLKERNVFFQINYSTLRKIENYPWIKFMLENDMIEFIGSDKHRTDDNRDVINWNEIEGDSLG